MRTFTSDISNQEFLIEERVSGNTIRLSILYLIQQEHPFFTIDSCLSISELNYYKAKYISEYISKQIGELTDSERIVLTSLNDKSILTERIDNEDEHSLTFGQKIADNVATFGGSWTFIISFGIFLLLWILLNVYWLANRAFDPYPFILLNLILSSLAAIQAPVIMMSQNRQEEKDRDRAKNDYMVNLKSELEIRMLHEKIDHLIIHQQQELLDTQKKQIELMKEILVHVAPKKQ